MSATSGVPGSRDMTISQMMRVGTMHRELGTLKVNPELTVGQLKEAIHTAFKEKIPPYTQRLFIGGLHLQDDTAVLKDLDVVKNDALIFIVFKSDMPVRVTHINKSLGTVIVRQAETIASVKQKIFEKLAPTIPPNLQNLYRGLQSLADDRKIEDLGLKADDEIILTTNHAGS